MSRESPSLEPIPFLITPPDSLGLGGVGRQRSGAGRKTRLSNFGIALGAYLLRAEVCLGAASPKARILPPAAFAPNARMLPPTFFFLLSTVTVKPILPIVGAGIYDETRSGRAEV